MKNDGVPSLFRIVLHWAANFGNLDQEVTNVLRQKNMLWLCALCAVWASQPSQPSRQDHAELLGSSKAHLYHVSRPH